MEAGVARMKERTRLGLRETIRSFLWAIRASVGASVATRLASGFILA
jgi:hypothetical protein